MKDYLHAIHALYSKRSNILFILFILSKNILYEKSICCEMP